MGFFIIASFPDENRKCLKPPPSNNSLSRLATTPYLCPPLSQATRPIGCNQSRTSCQWGWSTQIFIVSPIGEWKMSGSSFLLLQVILYVWRMVSNQKKNKEKHMFHTCSRLAILQTTSTHRYLSNKSCVFFLHKIHFHHHPLAQKKTMPLPSKQNPSNFNQTLY